MPNEKERKRKSVSLFVILLKYTGIMLPPSRSLLDTHIHLPSPSRSPGVSYHIFPSPFASPITGVEIIYMITYVTVSYNSILGRLLTTCHGFKASFLSN